MAKRAVSAKDRVAPSLTPQRAIELIQRQLQQFDRVILLSRNDPEVDKWASTTQQILKATFGEPHEMLESFREGPRCHSFFYHWNA